MEVLTRDPLVAGFGRLALARLVGAMERVQCAPGEVLCAAGQAAEHLYLLESGAAVLTTPSGRQAPLHALHCGEEAAAGLANYACTVTATSQVTAWRLPRATLADVVQLHPTLEP